MREPASDPTALAAELRTTVGRLTRLLREHTRKGELTASQRFALGRLEREGPLTVTALARAEGVRPQSMGATVAALEAQGLIIGAPDPADGRQTILSLTDAAREFIADSRAAREGWLLQAISARLSPAEQDQLAQALVLLRRLAEP
jgi:DNA-binding MarR family transcriptional regulator